MPQPRLRYSKYFETLIALATYLGAKGGDGSSDAATAESLATHLSLDKTEVVTILDGFPGIFRKSERSEYGDTGAERKYTLQLRYAKRKYVGDKFINAGEALSNEDLFALLNFISNRAREEQEDERQTQGNRVAIIGAWLAAFMSFFAVIVSLLK